VPRASDAKSADAESDEPKLSELQRRRIVSESKQIGRTAMAEWALDHLPHSSVHRNIQVVASWLMTLRELREFHRRVLEKGGNEHISGSVELHWGGKLNRGTLDGGSVHHLFNPAELAGSFEDSALIIAYAFCDYSTSDEIHEIRGSNWMLVATVVSRSGAVVPRRYVHKIERGSIKQQVGRELLSLGEIFTRDDETRERRRGRQRELMDTDLAIMVADALGHGKELKRVYNAAYDEAFAEKEADALRELGEGDRGRGWRRRRR
jgi:hypothetical protein